MQMEETELEGKAEDGAEEKKEIDAPLQGWFVNHVNIHRSVLKNLKKLLMSLQYGHRIPFNAEIKD